MWKTVQLFLLSRLFLLCKISKKKVITKFVSGV